jgi:Zn-dependent peptidase ImmA (M78 family)
MSTIAVNSQILNWARERSGLTVEYILEKFPKFLKWMSGEESPELKQLEKFAHKTYTPLGYLFLQEPPDETLPIPNFRTVKDKHILRPSPNLIETFHTMRRRQNWMHDYLIEEKETPLPFVGSVTVDTDIKFAAKSIRDTFGLTTDWAAHYSTWRDALAALRNLVDRAGILIARNGVVGNNNYRKLDVAEFRGFVLIDNMAPLIFINGADFEGAQMFTIAHELAHVWLGSGSIFNLAFLQPFDDNKEKFCNKVAAEFLVPENEIRKAWKEVENTKNPFGSLSKQFKVSTLVVARRALDLGFINLTRFLAFYGKYKEEQEDLQLTKKSKKGGGDFYRNQGDKRRTASLS